MSRKRLSETKLTLRNTQNNSVDNVKLSPYELVSSIIIDVLLWISHPEGGAESSQPGIGLESHFITMQLIHDFV